MRFKILRFDSIDSTNLEAMRQAKAGAPEGLCVVAREQTHGRGRQGRVWVSPRDAGLYFTITLRPALDLEIWPLITLATALAVTEALHEACKLRTDIKWPNDILFDDRKLCGILAETVETSSGMACVVGMGLNLTAESFPPELEDRATSIASATGNLVDWASLFTVLLQRFSHRYEALFETNGPALVVRDWAGVSSFANYKQVRVDTGSEVFSGTTCGLESDGALRVETLSQGVRIVRAGDVQSLRST
ncbi:MAG: BirA family transcriptional regulator [Blastocatellia bacterium]|nr:BirA family transcriptional regulator [Blastocatellia bacterium]